jgi:hypothetical protein
LLTAHNNQEAAKTIGVSPKTLLRWQKLPEFERAYREARLTAFRHSNARLQNDPATPKAFGRTRLSPIVSTL